MIRIAVIVGSTRPARRSRMVAEWVHEIAVRHLTARATVDLVDLAEYELPLLDEPVPAAFGEYRHEHTRRWAAAVGSYDGFVFVTPEYNHAVPAALKNAIDFLFDEWQDKAPASPATGYTAASGRWNSCDSPWASCGWPTSAPRWRSQRSPTSRSATRPSRAG